MQRNILYSEPATEAVGPGGCCLCLRLSASRARWAAGLRLSVLTQQQGGLPIFSTKGKILNQLSYTDRHFLN